MKFLSTVAVASVCVGVASALDMRFYGSLTCAGGWLQCGNLAPGVCCYSPTVPAAGMMLTSVSGVADFSAWGSQTCSGPRALQASTTGCKPAAFAFFSGNYRTSSTTTVTTSRLVSRQATNCVEPDSFGFVDESGKEHITKLTAANRQTVYSALRKGDSATLKVEAASALT